MTQLYIPKDLRGKCKLRINNFEFVLPQEVESIAVEVVVGRSCLVNVGMDCWSICSDKKNEGGYVISGWSKNPEIQTHCVAIIHEIASRSDVVNRHERALRYIAALSATLPTDFQHGNFFGTLAMAALYPDSYKRRKT